MPLHFRCTNCLHLLSIGRRKAGTETTCPICHHLQKIPDPANQEPANYLQTAKVGEPRRAAETAARLISLSLALAMLGFLGWLMWIFPRLSPPPMEQRLGNEEQLASLAEVDPLPLLQPEIESPPRDASAPLSSPLPPPPPNPPAAAKNRSSDPPPVLERRPPDLPSLAPPAKDTPKKKPPLPDTKRGEADSLGEELVEAAPEQQMVLLEKLRNGKGAEYTQALAAAIGRLSDEAKKKARQTLADRLSRFTSTTLLAYLGSENPELRRAAALALGMKDDKDHISELIDLLEDPEPSVVHAAHAALQKITNPDSSSGIKRAPEGSAEARTPQTPQSREPASPSRSSMPSAEVKAPAVDLQASKSKQRKQDDDLPDTSLVPPPESPPGVKAIIRANALALYSKRASDRLQAARALGGLAEEGKPARRLLCGAMLDPVIAVRVAAADALKNIDPKMHYLAVVLATENDADRLSTLLGKIQKLEDDGEPLAPLVAYVVKFAASKGINTLLTTALTTLSRIGKKDLSSYRVIATALTNRDPLIRAIALRGLARMKHGKLAVPRILALLKMDIPINRIAAIKALAALADESTEEIIAEAIATQRYHNDASVRRAVETALNKIENKQNP